MSEKVDKLKTMLDALKINAIVSSRDLGDQILEMADELEESAKLGQYADLLLNKAGGWQAFNTIWRSAVKILEKTIAGTSDNKRPLDKQNVLIIGSGSLAKTMTYGIAKRRGLVSIAAPDDEAAKALATEFDVRFVPFGNIYNTLADIVVIAEPGLPVGSHKSEFNPSYIVPRMTVCDATEMPFDSIYIKEARGRGASVVEPRLIYADQLGAQIKSITGKEVSSDQFNDVVERALNS